ncbi:MAG TPA: VF530 family protein [Chitinophagales bacterium]|nr:VF530 family protein [Chitinophagales bacterium]
MKQFFYFYSMPIPQPNNPLHGITLEKMLRYLLAYYTWEGLYKQVPANCFKNNPSIKSSLTFLRKTPWARQRLETIYIYITRDGVNEEWFAFEE